MNAVTATRRTIRREWTAFGALLIVSVGLMGMSGTQTAHDIQSAVNVGVRPVETFLNGINDTVASYWSALTKIDRLRTQNEQLKNENLPLQEELNRMDAISKLNDDWSKIDAAGGGVPYQTQPVRVIVRDISDVSALTLVIDKGTDDGLAEGQVVVDAGGAVVGRIQEADATVSSVLLISDPISVVVGTEAKSGATGTILGSISGQLSMSYIDSAAAAKMTVGEPVTTAGESLPGTNDTSPYPPGLLIGTITAITKDPNAVVQSATITPAAHLNDSTFLLVIVGYQGGFGPPVISQCPSPSNPGSSASPGAGKSIAPSTTCGPSSTLQPSARPSATSAY